MHVKFHVWISAPCTVSASPAAIRDRLGEIPFALFSFNVGVELGQLALLKNLAFAAIPKDRRSPMLHRRERLAERLADQLALVKDPGFTRTVRRWRNQDGQKVQVDHAVRIRPWWMSDEKGLTILTVRYGIRPIEFEKGKAGIVIGSRQKLSEVIEALISATRAGELDAVLEQSKPRSSSAKKIAA